MRLRAAIVLVALFTFSSCGLLKNHRIRKSQTSTSKDSTYQQTQIEKDQSVTVITEKADTTVSTKPVHIIKELPGKQENDSIASASIDSAGIKANVKYNKRTGSFKLDIQKEPEKIPVKVDRTTIRKNDIERNSANKGRVREETETEDHSKEKGPSLKAWITAGILFVLLGLALYYKLR